MRVGGRWDAAIHACVRNDTAPVHRASPFARYRVVGRYCRCVSCLMLMPPLFPSVGHRHSHRVWRGNALSGELVASVYEETAEERSVALSSTKDGRYVLVTVLATRAAQVRTSFLRQVPRFLRGQGVLTVLTPCGRAGDPDRRRRQCCASPRRDAVGAQRAVHSGAPRWVAIRSCGRRIRL